MPLDISCDNWETFTFLLSAYRRECLVLKLWEICTLT